MLRPLFVKLLFFLSLSQIIAQKLSQQPIPDWVESVNPDYKASSADDKSAGFYYLLLDDQFNAAQQAYYERYTYKITTKAGVQEMSDIRIEYDPEYQHVSLHKAEVIRNGKIINHLNLNDFKIIQREEDLERHLYNGRVTAVNHLYDIREGDIIDYAYTTIGRNPIHEGKFGATFYLQHTLPVAEIHLALLNPNGLYLKYNLENNAPEPSITQVGNATRYSWTATDTEAILYEANTPAWYFPAPAIELSAFENWASVARHYGKHYQVNDADKNKLKKDILPLLRGARTKSDSLTALVRFVQDEVRYLGFEDGLNSFKPSRPAEVLQRRFGDCKDKSLLLATLLQSFGVDASPVLVNSIYGKTIDKKLPSPFAFDHCIVQYKTDAGEDAYIDPTISDQGGTLETTYYPDYSFGLILNENTTKLTALKKSQKPKTALTETFSLDKPGGGAVLDIETRYYGGDADQMRTFFAANSTSSVQQMYTDYYSGIYPGIHVNQEVQIEDDRKANFLKVIENYKIDSLWSPSADTKGTITASFYPSSLDGLLYPASSADRKMPYLTDAEAHIEHKTIVYFPTAWNIKNDSDRIDNPGFTYAYDINYQNATLEITHSYEGKTDYLEAGQVAKYLEDHKKIQNQVNYQLTYGDSSLSSIASADSNYTVTVSLFILGLISTFFLCWFLYHTYDLPNTVQERWQQSLGGWVAFFGIGIVLTPVVLMFTLFFNDDLHLSSTNWEYLYSQGLALVVIAVLEVLYNSAYFIFSIFVAILYFQRRTIAPRMIIIMNVAVLVFFTVDNIAIMQLSPETFSGPEEQKAYGELFGVVLRSVIFICYFAFSERVKNTFTKTGKHHSQSEIFEFEKPEISPTQSSV